MGKDKVTLTEEYFGEYLAAKVKCSQMICPTKTDPFLYKPGGQIYNALENRLFNPEFQSDMPKTNKDFKLIYHDYSEMSHGFMTRGDMSKENVKRDVEHGWNKLLNFFGWCFHEGDQEYSEIPYDLAKDSNGRYGKAQKPETEDDATELVPEPK